MATRRLLIVTFDGVHLTQRRRTSTQPGLDCAARSAVQHFTRRVANFHARASWRLHADALRHARGQLAIDQVEQGHHPLAHDRALDPPELEPRRVDQVLTFRRSTGSCRTASPG